ncbi:unnamed protein product [Arctia plantaginis]|uniref:Uncharacterized protein n=1 Tax=Arctia plantaginis TaxID=874455 RepID=A0A8S0ZKN8_ARCPL|nr:unnamed protein product [Arctia plantaginis]CAB3231964.1 unnamed protein product [Arctia plantaginis]
MNPSLSSMESDDPDDDLDMEDEYLKAVAAEEKRQSGQLMRTVKRLLKGAQPGRVLGDRKVQVDLSYLSDPVAMNRTKVAMGALIKTFTPIPGRVEPIQVSGKGIFTLNVTNQYLSPDSDSSEPEKPKALHPATTSEIKKHSPPPVVLQALVNGVELTPKYTGLPKKILKYGDLGITEAGVAAAVRANPEARLEELLLYVLGQAGTQKEISLYKLR